MWVIYCPETGEEIDRTEYSRERDAIMADYVATNTWAYSATYRWEA